ncbi:MAG TPA: TRAP transporter large permease [Candidatus Methylomirabilis sp.]|nr:TRAP transporter large permease [Candidatus Methylomirabilis sp.]
MLLTLLMLGLVFLGMPISFALGVSSVAFLWQQSVPLVALPQRMAVSVDSFPLLAVPFFVLTGSLMNTGGVTRRIFALANSLVGHVTGGLAHVTVVANMFFAGISGAAVADAAALGPVMVDAMSRQGFPRAFAAGITAAASTIGPIIPPSIIMVIYAITAGGVSIGALFIGGVIPGILMGLSLMALVYGITRRRSYPRNAGFHFPVMLGALREAVLPLLTPAIILGGILGGVFTATESGAVAAVYALILGTLVYREIRFRDLPRILAETMITTAMVIFIVSTAAAFGWIMSYLRVPQLVAGALSAFSRNWWVIFMLLNLLYLFLGCIMEAAAIVIMTIPIIMPILAQVGIDPIHFGVVLAVNMSIGTLTPPVGIVMFVMCQIANLSVEEYTRATLPFILILIAVLFVVTSFPQLVLFLPRLTGN